MTDEAASGGEGLVAAGPAPSGGADATLDTLYALIAGRRGGDPAQSYTAKLFARGRAKIAQKLGEEAIETAIAAVQDSREEIVKESADLLYHLLVLWADAGIAPETVYAELARRTGQSGIAEKAARTGKG